MTSQDSHGLELEGWLSKLGEETLGIKKGQIFDPNQPMDDLAKMRWLMAIDQRFMLIMPKTRMGIANEQVVKDLDEIRADYEKLLQSGPTQYPFYTEVALHEKIADVLHSTAAAYESMRDYLAASQCLEAAVQSYNKIGKAEKAQQCQVELARMQFDQEGNLDKEIQRLRNVLSTLSEGTVGHVQALVDLGNLYNNNGDAYEAKGLLLEAEQELSKISANLSGKDLSMALEQSLLSIYQGQHTTEASPIETAMQIRGLSRLLYLSLAQIYETEDPQKSSSYREKAVKLDSREYNDEFSNSMLQALAGELGKLL